MALYDPKPNPVIRYHCLWIYDAAAGSSSHVVLQAIYPTCRDGGDPDTSNRLLASMKRRVG